MKNIFLLLLVLASISSRAQLNHDQRIQDSIIGWWNNNKFDNLIKPTTDTVQKKRIEIDNKIVEWMKKTYKPVAGLGTYRRQNFSKAFGVYFMVWNVSFDKMWLDDKGHFNPIAEENTPFAIQINTIPVCNSISFLNHGNNFYFTWEPDRYKNSETENHTASLKNNSNLNQYFLRGEGNTQIVILAPNHQIPFQQITIGEYLNEAEIQFEKELQKKINDITDQNKGNDASVTSRRESFIAYAKQEYEKYFINIKTLHTAYEQQLNEPAFIKNMQPTLSDFYGDSNPFDNGNYPVYKIKKEILDKCKSAQPQWVAIWFPFDEKVRGNQLHELYLAMTEHLNYNYIYNYFFDSEKVKGKDYTPSNEKELNERLNKYNGNKNKSFSLK